MRGAARSRPWKVGQKGARAIMEPFGMLIQLINITLGVVLIIAGIQAIRYLNRKLKQ